jgi:hypothetical protein
MTMSSQRSGATAHRSLRRPDSALSVTPCSPRSCRAPPELRGLGNLADHQRGARQLHHGADPVINRGAAFLGDRRGAAWSIRALIERYPRRDQRQHHLRHHRLGCGLEDGASPFGPRASIQACGALGDVRLASTPAPSNWVRFAEMESIQMLPPRRVHQLQLCSLQRRRLCA